MNIKIGDAARELRESLGLTQRAAAEALDITPVHLCNVEKNNTVPSQALLERYRSLWGIDVYVYAWCQHGDVEKLPRPLRAAAKALSTAWKTRITEAAKDLQRPAE